MDIFEQYGIPKDDIDTRSRTHVLDLMANEYPELYEELTHDPDIFKPLIEKWDLVFNTGVDIRVVARRRIEELFIAIREFIQNAYDAVEELYGYEEIPKRVHIYVDDLGFHIRDEGKGITYVAFKIYASEKKPWNRGYFGEGLNIALAFLVSQGYPTYIFSKGIVYKPAKIGSTLVIVMGRTNRYVDGTEVIIHGIDYEYAKKIADTYSFFNFIKSTGATPVYLNIRHPDYNITRIYSVVLDQPDKLFVADMFVNDISRLFGKPSVFSYNVWFVDLEPNRVALSDKGREQCLTQISWIYYAAAKLAQKGYELPLKIINEFIDKIFIQEDKIIKIRSDVFEVTEMTGRYTDDFTKLIAEKLNERFGEVVKLTDLSKLEWVLYKFRKFAKPPIIVVPTSLSASSLVRHVKSVESWLFEKEEEEEERKEEVPINRLSIAEAFNLGVAYTMYYIVFRKIDKPIKVMRHMTADGEYIPVKDEIRLSKYVLSNLSSTVSAMFEEISHKYGYKIKGVKARDVSRELEDAMTEVASILYSDKLLLRFAECLILPSENLEEIEKKLNNLEYIHRYGLLYNTESIVTNVLGDVVRYIYDRVKEIGKFYYYPRYSDEDIYKLVTEVFRYIHEYIITSDRHVLSFSFKVSLRPDEKIKTSRVSMLNYSDFISYDVLLSDLDAYIGSVLKYIHDKSVEEVKAKGEEEFVYTVVFTVYIDIRDLQLKLHEVTIIPPTKETELFRVLWQMR